MSIYNFILVALLALGLCQPLSAANNQISSVFRCPSNDNAICANSWRGQNSLGVYAVVQGASAAVDSGWRTSDHDIEWSCDHQGKQGDFCCRSKVVSDMFSFSM
ncbi:hypothetical protein DFH28DRAFT_892772 [Melampsora americana]|nr:hypothetical protein DFH28DRAFT_892772 [Melampsora americana]